MRVTDLPTPALLLDLHRLEANIADMAARAATLGVRLRPHVKTHKCTEIAERQRAAGARGLTVSTLYEARVFQDHGFRDLTWAYPVILTRLAEARDLAGEPASLGLVVDGPLTLDALEQLGHPFPVWLKVDTGYHRAGVDPGDRRSVQLARRLHSSRTLQFAGILSHSGHAYHARSRAAVARVAEQDRRIMARFAQRLRQQGMAVNAVSVGSTPAMRAVTRLTGVDEARPGNYVFYDYMQCALRSCTPRDCALTVLASVVSAQPSQGRAVIDAGALALSRDPGPSTKRRQTMGRVYADYAAGRLDQSRWVVSLSQEHGIVNAGLKPGTRLRILPNHACLTAAHFDEYHVVQGDRVIGRWKIWRGR